MEAVYSESALSLLSELGIDTTHNSLALQKLAAVDSRFIKDMKLNLSAVLKGNNINPKDAALLALATAANEKKQVLQNAFEAMARKEGANDTEIAEVYACTSIMNTNNVFYRFRHYMHDVEFYNKQPAGLRMSAMMNPVLGKELFELMSLVVSALNGCERCVTSHEHSVKEQGASEQRIYDAVRLSAVVKGLCAII